MYHTKWKICKVKKELQKYFFEFFPIFFIFCSKLWKKIFCFSLHCFLYIYPAGSCNAYRESQSYSRGCLFFRRYFEPLQKNKEEVRHEETKLSKKLSRGHRSLQPFISRSRFPVKRKKKTQLGTALHIKQLFLRSKSPLNNNTI